MLTGIKKNNRIQLTAMSMDVDYFKCFNETYGHLAGDAALKKIADILYCSLSRESDFWLGMADKNLLYSLHI